MQIILTDDIEKIASRTAFSYREVHALSLFEDLDRIDPILRVIAVSGMGVGMYLIQKGIPQKTVYRLLHEEAQYVREDDADGSEG